MRIGVIGPHDGYGPEQFRATLELLLEWQPAEVHYCDITGTDAQTDFMVAKYLPQTTRVLHPHGCGPIGLATIRPGNVRQDPAHCWVRAMDILLAVAEFGSLRLCSRRFPGSAVKIIHIYAPGNPRQTTGNGPPRPVRPQNGPDTRSNPHRPRTIEGHGSNLFTNLGNKYGKQ